MSKATKITKKDSAMSKYLTDSYLEMKELHPGDLIEGIVVSISHGELLVDVGAKSEGIVTGSELSDADPSYKNLQC